MLLRKHTSLSVHVLQTKSSGIAEGPRDADSLSTAAQLYEKSGLKGIAIDE